MQNTGNRTPNNIDNALARTHSNLETRIIVQEGTPQDMPSMFVPSTQTTLESMPADVKNLIFSHAAMPVEFQQGLVALAKASKELRGAVRDFMHNHENGKIFSTALKIGPEPQWQAQAKVLIQNAKIYRKDFLGSAGSICNNMSMKLTGEMASGALTRFKAIEFNLCQFEFNPAVSEQISSIRGKPVKINASGFKGELATLQKNVQTALSAVDRSCPVILDLSMNGLRDADLRPLLAFMKIKPIIYQLNLDGNPLCTDKQLAVEVIELFQLVSPISHLYLNQTGFNDATATGLRSVLGKHACLTHLDLRSNALTEVGAAALIDAVNSTVVEGKIPTNVVLQAVRLQNNKFGTAAAMALEAGAQGERSLQIVQLEDMTIFSPNFSPETINQQRIHNQVIESQRF